MNNNLNNQMLQYTKDYVIQPIIDFSYEHPFITIGIATTGSAVIFGTTTAILTSLLMTKPYVEDYIDEYSYLIPTIGIASVFLDHYFGKKIFYNNIKNSFTSKVGLGLLTVIGTEFAISNYYLGAQKTIEIAKTCLSPTIAVEILVDLLYMNPSNIYAPTLGYFFSCSSGQIFPQIFSNETDSNLKTVSIGFTSRAVGGIAKYGAKAYILEDSNLNLLVFKMAIIGFVNNGLYGAASACAKCDLITESNATKSCLLIEPFDVVMSAALNIDKINIANLKVAFEVAIFMYGFGELFVPIAEEHTQNIFDTFISKNTSISEDTPITGNVYNSDEI